MDFGREVKNYEREQRGLLMVCSVEVEMDALATINKTAGLYFCVFFFFFLPFFFFKKSLSLIGQPDGMTEKKEDEEEDGRRGQWMGKRE